MSAEEIQFRTATLGGFQKQDVLDYIERSSKDHGDKLAGLQRELEEARRALCAVEEEKGALARELAAAQEREAAAAAAGQASQETSALREELEAERLRLAETEAVLEQTMEEVDRLRPAAEAFARLKDRTAGIELEAHCRAQGVQAEAEERAQKTREQVEQWLRRMRAEYDRIREDIDAAVSQVSGGLAEAERIVEGLSGTLTRQDGELEELAQACLTDMGPKAPMPLPLEDK
jgi:chromosome segregation ATPase